MGRLIDADELLERIRLNYNNHQNVSAGAIKDMINTTNTAYDVEKVVVELEKESYQEYCDSQRIVDLKDAIDIVKRGGVEL